VADLAAALDLAAVLDLDGVAFFVLVCAVDMAQCVLIVDWRYVLRMLPERERVASAAGQGRGWLWVGVGRRRVGTRDASGRTYT
jgi:hypothetical protein